MLCSESIHERSEMGFYLKILSSHDIMRLKNDCLIKYVSFWVKRVENFMSCMVLHGGQSWPKKSKLT